MDIFQIPSSILPEVKQSADDFGCWNFKDHQIPIRGVAGDQQAALFGQECIEKGMAKNTYGTGCFMLMNTGEDPIISDHNLLTTIAWMLNDRVEYALEGSVFMGGAIVQWLRDELGIINSSEDIEKIISKNRDKKTPLLGVAFKMSTELVAAVLVGSIIGFIFDTWFGTKPWLILTFFFVGVIAGILNVIRSAKNMQK